MKPSIPDAERVADQLRTLKVDRRLLPLARHEVPYATLQRGALAASFDHLVRFPERRGPLSRAIRSLLRTPEASHERYQVLETHIDLSGAPASLENSLVAMGFEPDDFFKLHPECYVRHFSLAYLSPQTDGKRVNVLADDLRERTRAAQEAVDETPNVYGYIEMERYSSDCVRRYVPVTGDTQAAQDELAALKRAIDTCPCIIASIADFGDGDRPRHVLPSTAVKRSDIHIKIPGLIVDGTPAGRSVRSTLLSMKWYEIVSDAGNTIFTAQFMDSGLGVELYRAISACALGMLGVTQICLEPCIYFWRKSVGTGASLSPIPPVFIAVD